MRVTLFARTENEAKRSDQGPAIHRIRSSRKYGKRFEGREKKSSERFLRTHGQSILNAEKRWPNAVELVMNDSRPFSASVKLKTD